MGRNSWEGTKGVREIQQTINEKGTTFMHKLEYLAPTNKTSSAFPATSGNKHLSLEKLS